MNESPDKSRLFADRYLLKEVAGRGGMGVVYRAYDTVDKRPVALKLWHLAGHDQAVAASAAAPEAQWLAGLRHPGIVSYIAQGETPSGQGYLVMEWLDGEDLAQRLLEGPLGVADAALLLHKVAAALAVAHQQGVVHGDLKPSNLFLRQGTIAGVTLLDFGVAHSAGTPTFPRRAGGGTPNYLAPEVARGLPDVDARADIFSLGCLVYECLTGEPPFVAEHVTAVLAKTLFEEALPVQKRRPEVTAELAALLGRMLDKDPAARPRDAAALLGELEQSAQAAGTPLRASLSAGSLRLLTVIVATGITEPAQDSRFAALHGILAERGAQVECLANQTVLAAFLQPPSGEAADHAEQAVRGALLLKQTWPHAAVVVATGRGVLRQQLPVGEVVDRAMSLVHTAGDESLIRIDAATSGLISTRFAVREQGAERYCVVGERDLLDSSRLLLGRPTPCVGRDSELANLDAALTACIDRQTARVVVVTAAPGMGKSRLRHEFLRRLGSGAQALTVLMGRCDPMRQGSPYALISQALQRLCGISGSEEAVQRHDKLLARVAQNLPPGEVPHIAEFLGELCNIPSGSEPTPRMRAARNDAKIMTAQLSQVWVDFLRAECAKKPVMFILEDLHWGDALTVLLMDAALRELSDQPLFALVLGRPEMEESFPSLFGKRAPQLVRLGRLSKNASRQLVRHVLGAEVPAELLSRIVEQAAGNALYLEELIRATIDHKRAEPTDNILAMLQARLLRLDPTTRHFLRAASIFGEVFWLGGVSYLLGKEPLSGWTEVPIKELVAAEWLERPPECSLPQGPEYRFRHALLRDAAYSLLTDADRQAGHRLAGEYLQSVAERDPMVLAGHFQRGGDKERALPYYILAAEQALSGSDLAGALARVEHGLACAPHNEALGSLRAVQLAAEFWQDGWAQAVIAGHEAMALLPAGSMRWCRAAAIMLPVTNLSGDQAGFAALAQKVEQVEPAIDARAAFLQAAAYLVIVFSLGGQHQAAGRFLERVAKYRAELSADDVALHGIIKFCEVVHARQLGRDPQRQCQLAREGVALSEQAGDLRNALFVKPFWGIGLLELGNATAAEQVLRAALALAEKLHEPLLGTNVRVHLEMLLLSGGAPEQVSEALASAQSSVDSVGINPLLLGQSLINLAHALMLRGELHAAEATARRACAAVAAVPGHLNLAESVLIQTLLRLDRVMEASALARVALQRLAAQGCSGYAELTLRLAAIEALASRDDEAERARALTDALHELRIRAASLVQPAARAEFLHGVRTNQRLCELAARHGITL